MNVVKFIERCSAGVPFPEAGNLSPLDNCAYSLVEDFCHLSLQLGEPKAPQQAVLLMTSKDPRFLLQNAQNSHRLH